MTYRITLQHYERSEWVLIMECEHDLDAEVGKRKKRMIKYTHTHVSIPACPSVGWNRRVRVCARACVLSKNQQYSYQLGSANPPARPEFGNHDQRQSTPMENLKPNYAPL